MTTDEAVYIGLGSNVGDREAHLRQALDELSSLADNGLSSSPRYWSSPVGPQDQPTFINAVVGLITTLGPFALLDRLQQIEQSHNRARQRHWGPRTLDLDLLIYRGLTIDTYRLQVPHPELPRRAFVLRPLLDLAPELTLSGEALADRLPACVDQRIWPVKA